MSLVSLNTNFGKIPAPITVESCGKMMRHAFSEAGITSSDLDSRLLLAHVLKLSQAELISEPERRLSSDDIMALEEALRRRLGHEPVARIIGKREFWGRDFALSRDTLDPRPDTETLIEATLEIINRELEGHDDISILDLGTGSGCILLTLLAECPGADGVGIDISEGALRTARQNAQNLGLASRAQFVCGNWFRPLDTRFNIVVANPPYIPSGDLSELMPDVREHDPHRALDGGPDGLEAFRKILTNINEILTSGWIIFEVGTGQADTVCRLLRKYGICEKDEDCLIFSDLSGTIRTVAAKAR